MNIRRKGKCDGFTAYYYSFDPTNCAPVDNILMAVAGAGCSYHHTDRWTEGSEEQASPRDSIQAVAKESACEIARLTEELKIAKEKGASRERHVWIKCSERLPEHSTYVLLCNQKEFVQGVGYLGVDKNAFYVDGDAYSIHNTTHWMPLPNSPEEGEG